MNQGRLFTFGQGLYGQLGHGSEADECTPQVVRSLQNVSITRISAGLSHTVVLSDMDQILTFGHGLYGQLGHGDAGDSASPRMVEGLANVTITEISAGGYHTLALDDKGQVHTFGYGSYGLMGHGKQLAVMSPKPISKLEQVVITGISAGFYHTILSSNIGTAYSFGRGNYGQLGHGNTNNVNIPTPIDALKKLFVSSVSAGSCHTVVITDQGTVYSFGASDCGQLGHRDKEDICIPKEVSALAGGEAFIKQVSCGLAHTVALDDRGRVFTCGYGMYGALGHGDKRDCTIPTLIYALSEVFITRVSAGGNHSVVLSDEGVVYSFGSGEHGELGHGDQSNVTTPKVISTLEGVFITQISAGRCHTVVLEGECRHDFTQNFYELLFQRYDFDDHSR